MECGEEKPRQSLLLYHSSMRGFALLVESREKQDFGDVHDDKISPLLMATST